MSYSEELKCFLPIRYMPKFPTSNRSATYSGELKTHRTNNDINFKAYRTLTSGRKKTNLENNEKQPLSVLSSKIQRNKPSYLSQNYHSSGKKSLLATNPSDISQIQPLNDQQTYVLRSSLKSSTEFKRPNQTVKRVLFSSKSSPNNSKRLSKSCTATKTENLLVKTNLSITSESLRNKTDASTQTENEKENVLINEINSIKIDKSIQTDELGATCINYFAPNICVNTPDNSLTCFETDEMLLATNTIKIRVQKPSEEETPTVQEMLENLKHISEDLKKTIDEDRLKINDYFIDSKKKIDNVLKTIDDKLNKVRDKENITPRRSKPKTPKNTYNLRIETLKKSTLQNTPTSKKKYSKLDKSLCNYVKLRNIIPLETPKINTNNESVVTFKTSKAQLSQKCFTQIQDLERTPTFLT